MRGGRRCVGAWLAVAAAAAGCDGGSRTPDPPQPVSWFRDVSEPSGVDAAFAGAQTFARGLSVADVDADGRLDVLVAGGAQQVTYLRNLGGLQFENATTAAGLDGDATIRGVALADLDGDGDADALLAGTAGLALYRNDAGVFVAVTDAAGLSGTAASVGVLLVDADSDGTTDVFSLTPTPPNALFLNDGNGVFSEVSAGLDVDVMAHSWVAAAIDHDGDGDSDLYVGHDMLTTDDGTRPFAQGNGAGGPDHLFENRGFPSLVDVAETAGVTEPRSTMGIVFEDMTGDGRRDLFLTDFGRNDLLAARGDGTFEDATVAAGLDEYRRIDDACPADQSLGPRSNCWYVSWSALYEDFDRDGARDLIVVNSSVDGDRHQPVQMWQQTAPGQFTPVADPVLGFTGGRGAAAADLDDDGDLDLFVPSKESLRLYENIGTGARVIAVTLRGTASNPDGLGADVTAVFDSGRRQTRRIGVGGKPHSWGPTTVHFSGGGDPVVHLEVRWPSGIEQTSIVNGTGPVELVEPDL